MLYFQIQHDFSRFCRAVTDLDLVSLRKDDDAFHPSHGSLFAASNHLVTFW